MSRLAAFALVLAAAISAPGPVQARDEGLDRYRDLLHRKRTLERENAWLTLEARLAAGKDPYIVFDAAAARMDFRVRGVTFKSYSFSAVSLDPWTHRPPDPERIWRAIAAPIEIEMKEGGNPELIPPDPETGREAGLLYSDPNQLASQTGAVPVSTDAGLLGVDAPTDYDITFGGGLIIRIRSDREKSFRERAANGFGRLAAGARAALSGLLGGKMSDGASPPPLRLYLSTDEQTAKHLHFSLLPGEKFVVAPPPPRPVSLVLVAAGR